MRRELPSRGRVQLAAGSFGEVHAAEEGLEAALVVRRDAELLAHLVELARLGERQAQPYTPCGPWPRVTMSGEETADNRDECRQPDRYQNHGHQREIKLEAFAFNADVAG